MYYIHSDLTMINREKLEEIMFTLDVGECNTCGKKCKKYFCSKPCEEAYEGFKELVKDI